MIHAESTRVGWDNARGTSTAPMKIDDPSMVPTVMSAVSHGPKPRTRPGARSTATVISAFRARLDPDHSGDRRSAADYRQTSGNAKGKWLSALVLARWWVISPAMQTAGGLHPDR